MHLILSFMLLQAIPVRLSEKLNKKDSEQFREGSFCCLLYLVEYSGIYPHPSVHSSVSRTFLMPFFSNLRDTEH